MKTIIITITIILVLTLFNCAVYVLSKRVAQDKEYDKKATHDSIVMYRDLYLKCNGIISNENVYYRDTLFKDSIKEE